MIYLYYRGARLIVHWLIDQFCLIDQICTEQIGVSSNKFIWLIDQFWLMDQFLAAKTVDPLSGPLCIHRNRIIGYSAETGIFGRNRLIRPNTRIWQKKAESAY